MNFSGFNYFQFLWKIYETTWNKQAANSHSTTPSENENDDKINHIEKIIESPQY